MEPYIDEEDLLGFHVFVAELELVTGTNRGGVFDEVALLELLQKLLLSVEHTDVKVVKEYQRRCEQTLVSLLLKGLCREVRELICVSLSKMYAVGDRLPLFSQVNALQGILLSKDAFGKKISEDAKLGMLSCLTLLCCDHGSHLVSSLPSLISIGVKHAMRSPPSNAVRLATAKLISAALCALANDPRHAVASQAESLKLAERYIKTVKCDDVRVAGFKIIQSVAQAGAAAMWIQGGAAYDEIFKLALSTLNEASHSVRRACSQALGELMAVRKSPVLQDAIEKETRDNKKQNLLKLASRGFPDVLSAPFCEAAAGNKKAVCVSLAKAWATYLSSLSTHSTPDENDIVRHSIEFISMLSKLPALQPDLKPRDFVDLSVELGHGLATGEFPMAQACVLYALRTGPFRILSESGQRKLVDQLGTLLSSVVGSYVPAAVCSLEAVRVLLSFLGEVSPETASDLGITFMEKLVSNSAAIRSQAAAALGSLVIVDPACAATLITSCMEFLKNQVEQLTSLSARYGAMHPLPGNVVQNVPDIYSLPEDTVKKSQDSRTREAMHAVYGYATGVASLLTSASTTVLNVPSKLFNESFDLAHQLIKEPNSTVAKSWAIEMKAGYCILGALCVAMPLPMLKSKGDLLELWEPALGSTAQALILNKDLMKSGKEIDLALQLWWRSEGLLALEAYTQSIVMDVAARQQKQEMQRIVAMLAPLLEGLVSSRDLQDPSQAPGGPGGWVAGTLGYLQLRLLTIFHILPDASVFSGQYSLLIKLCSQPFSPTSSLLGAPTTAMSIASVLLQTVLDAGDSHLGPWDSEQEPLEEKLDQMTGEKGAPHYAGWECGTSVWGVSTTDASRCPNRIEFEPLPFPQYTSLAVGLVQSQLKVFAMLLRSVTTKNKLQLLESLIACSRSVKSVKNPTMQQALISSISFTLIAGLGKSRGGDSPEVAKKVVELVMSLVEEGKNSATLRAAAEITAIAVQFGDDSFALRLVKQLSSDLTSTSSGDRQRFLLLAMGSLFRSKGGMCLQTVLPNVVTLLIGYIKKSSGSVLLWALHGLYLTANSAGLTFMPYVRVTLELSQKLMTGHSDIESIRPYIGRLTNAMVALLGPELLPGSKNYIMCKTLMRQMKSMSMDTAFTCTSEGIPGALELVLYAQQLILFAPQAVPAKNHVSILMQALSLPYPSLRHSAAITLRHLTERDPQAICQEGIERLLFHALDVESEAHISHALRLTLEALQFAQCPARPSVWLNVCSSIVLLNTRESAQRERTLHKEGSLMREAELEEGDEIENEYGATPGSPQDNGRTPHLRTRLFACQCLLKIFEAVGSNPLHFDLVQAKQTSGSQEYLVTQLQEIIRLGFSLSTGQVEALQPEGIKLLNEVILHFGEADDPDMDDSKLLFQFQAQFVSPLRQALAPVAPPLLFMSGSTLAVSFLRSGLGGNDSAVLKQLVGLLVEPVLNWNQLLYRSFSEWVSACVRVSLLEAHAHCTVLAETGKDELCSQIVEDAQKPVLDQLKYLWLGLLTDNMVLNRWRTELWSDYKPSVICIDKHSVHSTEKMSLDEAWPVVLRAVALHIPTAEEMKDHSTLANTLPSSETSPRHIHVSSLPEGEGELSSLDVYWRLLDITTVHLGTSSMKVIEQAKSEDGIQHSSLNIEPICTCMGVLRTLLGSDYMSAALCPADICLETIEMIMSIIQQVIHPIVCSLSEDGLRTQQKLLSVVFSASELLKGISSGLTDTCVEHPGFISSLLDCVLCCSSILSPSAVTQNAGTPDLEKGRINCFASAQIVFSTSPWELTRNWHRTFVQHAIHIIEEEDMSESLLDSVCSLLKTSVRALLENGGDVTNGHETMTAVDLAGWTMCSLLDLIRKQAVSIRAATPVSRTKKDNRQNRLFQLLSTACALLPCMVSSENAALSDELHGELMSFLAESLEVSEVEEIQTGVLKALKTYLQEASVSGQQTSLTALCIVDLGPIVAALAHEKIALKTSLVENVFVIAECLKYLILTLGLPEVAGKEAFIFQVLVPLFIESMECISCPPLVQMSFKLVSHISAGKHAASFKAAIGDLAIELKQRFQKGIQSAVGVDAKKTDVALASQATEQKPSIVLKNFSVQ